MKLLIKSATLVDNTSDLNFKVKDILIEDGFITDISDKIESKADKIIKHKGVKVIGYSNYPSRIPGDSSTLFSKNIFKIKISNKI